MLTGCLGYWKLPWQLSASAIDQIKYFQEKTGTGKTSDFCAVINYIHYIDRQHPSANMLYSSPNPFPPSSSLISAVMRQLMLGLYFNSHTQSAFSSTKAVVNELPCISLHNRAHLGAEVVQLSLRLLGNGNEQHWARVCPQHGIPIHQVRQVLWDELLAAFRVHKLAHRLDSQRFKETANLLGHLGAQFCVRPADVAQALRGCTTPRENVVLLVIRNGDLIDRVRPDLWLDSNATVRLVASASGGRKCLAEPAVAEVLDYGVNSALLVEECEQAMDVTHIIVLLAKL